MQSLFHTIPVPWATLFLTVFFSALLGITIRAGPESHPACLTMATRTGPSEDTLKAMSGNEVAFVFLNPLNELFINKVNRSCVLRQSCCSFYTSGCTSCSAIRRLVTDPDSYLSPQIYSGSKHEGNILQIFKTILAERDTALEGNVLFETQYPCVQRKLSGRRGAADAGGKGAAAAVVECTSPVYEVDFSWVKSTEQLESQLRSESQAAFQAAAKTGTLPGTKLCAGSCGKSYPKGRWLEGTKQRVSSFWPKGEWKKAAGTARCILCVMQDKLAVWRSLSHQPEAEAPDPSLGKDPVVPLAERSKSPVAEGVPETPSTPSHGSDLEGSKSPNEDAGQEKAQASILSCNKKGPFPDDKLFFGGVGSHKHLMAMRALSSRLPVEVALAELPDSVGLDEKIARTAVWWTRVFLGDETTQWVPWSHEFEAEALCSRQGGADESDDMFVGRLRFTGKLRLRPGMDANGTGGAASWGPLLDKRQVMPTEDGWEIPNYHFLPCYYEGDLDKLNFSMAEGDGGFYVGAERRELYSGPFTSACCIDADESLRTGAPRHTSLAGLYGLYLLQHNMWIRAWRAETDECDGTFGTSSHIEIRRPVGGDESVCYESRGKRLWKGSVEVLKNNMGSVGDRVFAGTPLVIEWVLDAKRAVYPWLGDLAGRPSSVVEAESCDGASVELVRHSGWVSLEACYPFGEQIHFRKDESLGRNRVLYLAYGPYDSDPLRRECRAGSPGSYCWDRCLDFNNVVAVVYNPMEFNRDNDCGHPIGTPFTGNHSECLVYFDDREDIMLAMTCVFRGRPVAMPPSWAADRFADQWAHALECPNIPVMVGRKRNRFWRMNPRQVSLMDMELLLALHKEDIASAVKRDLSSPTRSGTSSGVLSSSSVSVLLGDLQRRFVYGFTPVTQELLRLGLGDMSSLHLGGEMASVSDRLWQDVPKAIAVKSTEIKRFTHQLAAYPCIADDTLGGKNNPFIPLVDGPVGLVTKRDKAVLNLQTLTYVPHSGRHPFVATFAMSFATRVKKLSGHRKGYTAEDFEMAYAVSATWVRQYYHTLVVQMAVRGMWDGKRFRKAINGGDAVLTSVSSGGAKFIKGTQPETWEHLTPKTILDVGNAAGAALAGCARGALVGVLRTFMVVDEGAVNAVSEWDPWVKWDRIGGLVANVNHASTLHRSYKVLKFRQPGTLGHEEPRSVFNLLLSPLGRRYLYASGVRRVLLRPVYKNGWQNHMVALVADANGAWSLLDPDDGGESLAVTVLHGRIPSVTKVLAAFAVCTEAKRKAGTTAMLCPEHNQELVHSSMKSYTFPVAPTDGEGRVDFTGYHLRTALAECLFQMGLPGLPAERLLHLPVTMDVSLQDRTKVWWQHMLSGVALSPPMALRMSQFERLPSERLHEVKSFWGPPRGGPDGAVTFFAVEGVPRYSVSGATAVVLVVVTVTRREYFCPRHHMYKSVGTPASMGFVGPVTEYFIDHLPKGYRCTRTRGAEQCIGSEGTDVDSTASLLDRDVL